MGFDCLVGFRQEVRGLQARRGANKGKRQELPKPTSARKTQEGLNRQSREDTQRLYGGRAPATRERGLAGQAWPWATAGRLRACRAALLGSFSPSPDQGLSPRSAEGFFMLLPV